MKWLFALKTPSGRLARWALQLQSYNLKFEYLPGRLNIYNIADTLSRPPCNNELHQDVCEYFSFSIDFPYERAAEFRLAQLEDEDLTNVIDAFEIEIKNLYRYLNREYIMFVGFCIIID